MHPTRLCAGAIAGLIATVPMTLAMLAMQRVLPRREQQRLPPEQVTSDLVQRSGLRRAFPRKHDGTLAWVLHFAFGTGAGALYAGLSPGGPLPAWLRGPTYGVLVWVGAYFGWLPSLQLHGHGAEQTWRRNALMLAAHLVWGGTLGVLLKNTIHDRRGSASRFRLAGLRESGRPRG